ncbi:MAG: hypothetical protein GWP75_09705, partial [Planctomycetia bacterium]|nr:hypothetical protein [Planctomycetia bacterium]
LVRQLWLDAYNEVLSGPQVEVISTPPGLRGLALRMKSSMDVSTARRNAASDAKKVDAMRGLADVNNWQLGGRQININRSGRRLNRDARGGYGREGGGE